MPCLASASGSWERVMLLRFATSCSAAFTCLVRDLEAGVVGALHLDLLQHQALEHLLAQHVLRRQLELLLRAGAR